MVSKIVEEEYRLTRGVPSITKINVCRVQFEEVFLIDPSASIVQNILSIRTLKRQTLEIRSLLCTLFVEKIKIFINRRCGSRLHLQFLSNSSRKLKSKFIGPSKASGRREYRLDKRMFSSLRFFSLRIASSLSRPDPQGTRRRVEQSFAETWLRSSFEEGDRRYRSHG